MFLIIFKFCLFYFIYYKFLATGGSCQTIAFNYLSHSTVHVIILEVCQAINVELLAEFIPTPEKKLDRNCGRHMDYVDFPELPRSHRQETYSNICSSEQWITLF